MTYKDKEKRNEWARARRKRETPEEREKRLSNMRERQKLRKKSDNESARKRWLKRKTIVAALKLTAGCIDCGYRSHAVALDLDHRVPAEKHSAINKKIRSITSALRNYSWDIFWEEIEKCDVRCANCHRVRTEVQRDAGEFKPFSRSIEVKT